MAKHRRVEARNQLSGTGMSSTPERIQKLQDERARRERANHQSEKSFSDVMQESFDNGMSTSEEVHFESEEVVGKDEGEGDMNMASLNLSVHQDAAESQAASRMLARKLHGMLKSQEESS